MILIEFARRVVKKIIYGAKSDRKSFVKYLRRLGVSIGEGTIIYAPEFTTIDTTMPKLLKIGNNVRITSGVTILTHDYSWSVIAGVYGECVGGIGPVTIGNNVFIGVKSIILKDTVIEDNVIIGAGSVVSGVCEANSVYAGVPAKKIMTLDEFYTKKKESAMRTIRKIMETLGEVEKEELLYYLREHACYFQDTNEPEAAFQICGTGYSKKCEAYYVENMRPYQSLDELIEKYKRTSS